METVDYHVVGMRWLGRFSDHPAKADMRILAIEPFFGGSHRLFLEGYRKASRHEVEIAGLPARKWKWRMRGAAIHFAEAFRGRWGRYDLLLASDFLSLADLCGLAPRELGRLPKVVYFHENQLTYPCRAEAERDYQYAFTNITTCLAADRVFFNSAFHRREFLDAVGPFLRRMPDFQPSGAVEAIGAKSGVLHFGLDLASFRRGRRPRRAGPAVILWNHRWEFDKAPEVFFETLFDLKREGLDFRLAVAGERFKVAPVIFETARRELADRMLRFGRLPARRDYVSLLRKCDIVCSTAIHEFFGVAVVEAVAAGCRPLLPDRLSYPELLPEEARAACLYRTAPDFKKKLRAGILGVERSRGAADGLASAMRERFDWKALAPVYDRELASVAQGFQ